MVKIEDEKTDKEQPETTQAVSEEATHDPYFAPIVNLPEVEVETGEDEEIELFKIRAKLFRFDTSVEPPEWKERGTGDVKLMQHKSKKGKIRVIMRRDKTLKICANHFIQPWMLLRTMKGSDRAWMWLVQADYADEEAKAETLAIRFANSDNAKKFKDAFDNAVVSVTESEADRINKAEDALKSPVKDKSPVEKKDQSTDKPEEALASLTLNDK